MSFGKKKCTFYISKKNGSILREYDSFLAIYVDDILVYNENKKKHIGHLQLVFKIFE